ncbi:MAG: hypothetical protein HFJ06_01040 [Lachnospiraceae bacterium]|nr:hypothetical protein [Lachnospiraceae bacterium]
MEEQDALSEKTDGEESNEDLDYKALEAQIKLIKWKYNGMEKEIKAFTKKDYIQVVIVIVICLCVLVIWALFVV